MIDFDESGRTTLQVVPRRAAADRGVRPALGGVAAMLAIVVLALISAGPAAAAYEQVGVWDADYPQPIALDAGGNLVVGSNTPGDSHVTIYSPGGQRLTAWESPEGFNTITGIAVDPQSRVHVTDLDGVQVFDAQGRQLESLTITIKGQKVTPFAIDVDARGDQYLTHGETVNGAVGPGALRFSAAGQALAEWGGAGAGPGQFSPAPLGIASDGRGNVYVSDTGNDRVQHFSEAGAYLGEWGQLGSGPGQFSSPAGLAVDAAGNVFVVDEGNGRVQVFDRGGALIDTVALSDGARSSASTDPRDIAVAPDGTLYITESALFGRKIYVYRPAVAAPPAGGPPSGGKPPVIPPPPSKPAAGGAKIATKSVSLRKGKIAVAIECTSAAACRGKVRLLAGKIVLGARKYKVKAGARATVPVEVTRRGGRLLARAKPAKITVKLLPVSGPSVTKKLPLQE